MWLLLLVLAVCTLAAREAPAGEVAGVNALLASDKPAYAPGEPMTAQPSVGKSVYLKLDPATMQFGIVEPNFEGESR